MDDSRLFDPGPPEEQLPKPGSGLGLYVPDKLRSWSSASPEENERVRALMREWVDRQAAQDTQGTWEERQSRARGALGRHSTDLGLKLGIRTWGEPRKLRHEKPGLQARYDSSYTNLRQFHVGRDMAPWALLLVEAALCDLAGKPLPGGAYNAQGNLLVDPRARSVPKVRRAE